VENQEIFENIHIKNDYGEAQQAERNFAELNPLHLVPMKSQSKLNDVQKELRQKIQNGYAFTIKQVKKQEDLKKWVELYFKYLNAYADWLDKEEKTER